MAKKTIEERFFDKVEISEHHRCWLWKGMTRNGYGLLYAGAKYLPAHRYAYELFVGPIPEGAIILHSCDVPRCVNPKHLRPGTHAENVADMRERGRLLCGMRNPGAKLTPEAVNMIRTSEHTLTYLARLFGVTPTTISDVRRGKRWRQEMGKKADIGPRPQR